MTPVRIPVPGLGGDVCSNLCEAASRIREGAHRAASESTVLLLEFPSDGMNPPPTHSAAWIAPSCAVVDSVLEARVPVISILPRSLHGPLFEASLASAVTIAPAGARLGFWSAGAGTPVPLGGGATLLSRQCGPGAARRLLLAGPDWSAEELQRAGAVQRIVPAEALDPAAGEEAAGLLARSPVALEFTREALGALVGRTAPAALARERALFALAFAGDDVREGVAAFFEKRPPCFRRGPREPHTP